MPEAPDHGGIVHFTVDRTRDGHVVRNHGVQIAGPFRTAEQAQRWLDRDTERLYALSAKAKARARASAEASANSPAQARTSSKLDSKTILLLAGVAGLVVLLLALFFGGIALIVIYWKQILVIVIAAWLIDGLMKKWFGT